MGIVPWDTLNDFIYDWMKGLQILIDSEALDPDADNSMLPLTELPYRFDTTQYGVMYTYDLIDGYSDADKGFGYQPWLFGYRLTLYNNNLTIPSIQLMGKNSSPWWTSLTDADIAAIESAAQEVLGISIVNSYPAEKINIKYSNYGNVWFEPAMHSDSDIKIKIPIKNGTFQYSTSVGAQFDMSSLPAQNGDYYDPPGIGELNIALKQTSSKTHTIVVFDNDLDASRLVNDVLSVTSDNNDVINYTKAGSEYKLYYGDTYLVYALDDTKIYNYQDFFTGTSQASTAISGWFPSDPPVVTPTYDDVKYGPEPPPEPDIDDDIEVEMDLNDAAFGEGLSHYYVTTVDAPVLSDISAAMSSWNINNTGKDLYRNLLSCRITKVGPIPAENSTFVIYGEELQYNGSPISINKITGNPSMDLGEYEILPKFNDFRDYAPYTKIEMFIPYCGWVALPSHVMSSEEKPKIITGTLLCDIIAGTCKAVIKCNETVVAEASGFTAVDVPFTGENVGMKMAGIASAITSYGNTASKTVGNIASGGLSGGAGAGASAAGGLVGLLGSYAQLHSAFNANYTEICGKTGDGCNVAGLNKVYIKIQRPKTGGYEAPDFVPEDYGHTTGFIAMKKSQISECEGLIVCANPDTSGIGGATDRERQMIKNLLESGIIVRQTEPEP